MNRKTKLSALLAVLFAMLVCTAGVRAQPCEDMFDPYACALEPYPCHFSLAPVGGVTLKCCGQNLCLVWSAGWCCYVVQVECDGDDRTTEYQARCTLTTCTEIVGPKPRAPFAPSSWLVDSYGARIGLVLFVYEDYLFVQVGVQSAQFLYAPQLARFFAETNPALLDPLGTTAGDAADPRRAPPPPPKTPPHCGSLLCLAIGPSPTRCLPAPDREHDDAHAQHDSGGGSLP
jgi:hypothetical protein